MSRRRRLVLPVPCMRVRSARDSTCRVPRSRVGADRAGRVLAVGRLRFRAHQRRREFRPFAAPVPRCRDRAGLGAPSGVSSCRCSTACGVGVDGDHRDHRVVDRQIYRGVGRRERPSAVPGPTRPDHEPRATRAPIQLTQRPAASREPRRNRPTFDSRARLVSTSGAGKALVPTPRSSMFVLVCPNVGCSSIVDRSEISLELRDRHAQRDHPQARRARNRGDA